MAHFDTQTLAQVWSLRSLALSLDSGFRRLGFLEFGDFAEVLNVNAQGYSRAHLQTQDPIIWFLAADGQTLGGGGS